MALQPGLVGTASLVVAETDTALHLGSGDVPVLATPRVVLLAEQAAVAALAALVATAACKPAAEEAKATPYVTATTGVVATGPFRETIAATGAVVPRPGSVAQLSAPAATRVANILAVVGQPVKQGAPLVEFERAPFEAAAAGAEAALQTAERAAERAKRLADAGVGPRKEAEQAAAELAAATSNAVTARRARELATLRSPIAGVVTRLSAVLGASADAGQSLVDVSDTGALDVVAALDPASAASVARGQSVTLFAGAAADGAPVGNGTVADVAMAVDTPVIVVEDPPLEVVAGALTPLVVTTVELVVAATAVNVVVVPV